MLLCPLAGTMISKLIREKCVKVRTLASEIINFITINKDSFPDHIQKTKEAELQVQTVDKFLNKLTLN